MRYEIYKLFSVSYLLDMIYLTKLRRRIHIKKNAYIFLALFASDTIPKKKHPYFEKNDHVNNIQKETICSSISFLQFECNTIPSKIGYQLIWMNIF